MAGDGNRWERGLRVDSPPELMPLFPPVHVGRFGSRWDMAAAALAGVLIGWAIARRP